jgi:glyoxylase-like metal-dependent hydrolase (beta-lactamase superfamily II)
MEIIVKTLGLLTANCFILRDKEDVIIIDPGGNFEFIQPYIENHRLAYVINTHGHYDHIAANNPLKAHFDTKLLIGEYDYEMLLNPELNLSLMVDAPYISVAPDILLKDGDRIPFGSVHLEVIHTPGHTKGSVCLKMNNILFSGDTLFYRSIGRTDLPTGSFEELESSIKTKLYTLPDETKVYTGHGEHTLIGDEKRANEFVRA